MLIPPKEDRPAFFAALFEEAAIYRADQLNDYNRHMAQYLGSDEIDNSTERACATRNITYELLEAEVTSEIPSPKVDPRYYSERGVRNAKAIEQLCCQLRAELPFERQNDLDERYTYIYGGSVRFVEWDSSIRRPGEEGGVRLTCLPPHCFYGQPAICEVEDMEYCFLKFDTTREELVRRFGARPADAAEATLDVEDSLAPTPAGSPLPSTASAGEEGEGAVTVVICFYRDEEGRIGRFCWSGDTVLSDMPNYGARRQRVCRRCGKSEGECRCEAPLLEEVVEEEEILTSDISLSDGRRLCAMSPAVSEEGLISFSEEMRARGELPMAPTRIPRYVPRSFPIVIRRNTSREGQVFGYSDCFFIRPQQQQINKLESRILQKLLRAGITPMVPEDARIAVNNTVFGQVIRLRPGENRSQYGVIDTTPDIAQDIAQSDRLYQQAKRILGISDSYLGLADATAQSGAAKRLQIEQAAGRLDSKRRMKYSAFADIDRLLFEYYLAYADTPRRISWRDGLGRIHDAEFNRYDFVEYDPVGGRYFCDDGYLFSVDLNGAPEQQRELMWEKNLENLKSGALGDPANPETLLRYWQSQERSHYPFARENVEYFESVLRQGPQGMETPPSASAPTLPKPQERSDISWQEL